MRHLSSGRCEGSMANRCAFTVEAPGSVKEFAVDFATEINLFPITNFL